MKEKVIFIVYLVPRLCIGIWNKIYNTMKMIFDTIISIISIIIHLIFNIIKRVCNMIISILLFPIWIIYKIIITIQEIPNYIITGIFYIFYGHCIWVLQRMPKHYQLTGIYMLLCAWSLPVLVTLYFWGPVLIFLVSALMCFLSLLSVFQLFGLPIFLFGSAVLYISSPIWLPIWYVFGISMYPVIFGLLIIAMILSALADIDLLSMKIPYCYLHDMRLSRHRSAFELGLRRDKPKYEDYKDAYNYAS